MKSLRNKGITYKQNIISFDIETTSMVDYKKQEHRNKPATIEVDKKYAFMYCGAFYNSGVILHIRTWDEVIEYIDSLCRLCKTGERYIIWVHNLSFEFQFMKDFMKLSEVFCRKAHNVLKCVYKNKIEFRDTLALSNCKLEKLAKNEKLGVQKLVGDLDYSKIRHQLTEVTEKEWGYVDNDVIIVAKYIEKKLKEYTRVENIPMTSTGEVRYLFRKELGKNLPKIHSMAVLYSASTMELQNLLIEIYAGAYTHCNYQVIDQIVYDLECKDIASSYPFQMVARKYPTIWYKLAVDYDLKSLFARYPVEDYALACRARFYNIHAKHCHSIISLHKCQKIDSDPLVDNGRVVSAKCLEIACNEIDLMNICDFYNFDDVEIFDVYTSKKQYLPKELVRIILKLFKDKTELKGIEEEEENYMRSKGRINGVYGTSVFNILDSGTYFDESSNMKFMKDEKTFADFKKFTNSPNQYLWYSIGVWVTSYAKRQVLTPIKHMSENAIYCDTDSVKYKDGYRYDRYWDRLNTEIMCTFKKAMKYHNFSLPEYTFFDKDGKEHFMGIFETEEPYSRFKSLGSKRYLVEFYDGSMKSTVAGAPKNLVDFLGKTNDEKFINFKNNFSLKDCKLTHTYTEGKTLKVITDYQGNLAVVDIRSGVCLTPADFTMNLSDNFIEFLLGRIDFTDKSIYRYFLGQQKYEM